MSGLGPGVHRLTLNGARQVYHVAGDGPVMVAHSGGPGVDYTYLRSARLEEHFTMVYLEPVGTGESRPLPDGATAGTSRRSRNRTRSWRRSRGCWRPAARSCG
jgi:hypothetical protein